MSCSRIQHSEAVEARTRGPSVTSQALYHCAPIKIKTKIKKPYLTTDNISSRADLRMLSVSLLRDKKQSSNKNYMKVY